MARFVVVRTVCKFQFEYLLTNVGVERADVCQEIFNFLTTRSIEPMFVSVLLGYKLVFVWNGWVQAGVETFMLYAPRGLLRNHCDGLYGFWNHIAKTGAHQSGKLHMTMEKVFKYMEEAKELVKKEGVFFAPRETADWTDVYMKFGRMIGVPF